MVVLSLTEEHGAEESKPGNHQRIVFALATRVKWRAVLGRHAERLKNVLRAERDSVERALQERGLRRHLHPSPHLRIHFSDAAQATVRKIRVQQAERQRAYIPQSSLKNPARTILPPAVFSTA